MAKPKHRIIPLAASAIVVLIIVLALPSRADDQSWHKAERGSFEVETLDKEWTDETRERTVMARAYLPQASADRRLPVVVFSHGLWGTRETYEYFGRHLASHGYLVILPQHEGSDRGALTCLSCVAGLVVDWLADNPKTGSGIVDSDRKILRSSIQDPDNLINRPLDISFVIDRIATDPQLSIRADMDRIGVAGHSFGAFTSMAIGGMTVDLPADRGGPDRSFRDERVKAVLPMSPQGPGTMGISEEAWRTFGVPAMFLTGTNDYGSGSLARDWRRSAFDRITGFDSYLITFKGAGHATFGPGNDRVEVNPVGPLGLLQKLRDSAGFGAPAVQSAEFLRMTNSLSTAFFDTYLVEDPQSTAWLQEFMAGQPKAAEVEFKPGD